MTARIVTIGGVEATVPEHARRGGISRQLLRYRLKRDVPEERLFEAPRALPSYSDETVDELRRRAAAGEAPAVAARAVGMSTSHARNVIDGFVRTKVRGAP